MPDSASDHDSVYILYVSQAFLSHEYERVSDYLERLLEANLLRSGAVQPPKVGEGAKRTVIKPELKREQYAQLMLLERRRSRGFARNAVANTGIA